LTNIIQHVNIIIGGRNNATTQYIVRRLYKLIVNVAKLKGKIIERNTTQESVADAIGIDRATFYRKMKQNGLTFSIGEIHRIVKAIPLTNGEAIEIFLGE
jgi:DNA-binding XRE family transcriptional regulator